MNEHYSDLEKFVKQVEFAKKGINPDCKHCGGTGYDPHPNYMTTYPICLECESWAKEFICENFIGGVK